MNEQPKRNITKVKVVLGWKSPKRWKRNKRMIYLPDDAEDVTAEIEYTATELRSEKIELTPHWNSPQATEVVRKKEH